MELFVCGRQSQCVRKRGTLVIALDQSWGWDHQRQLITAELPAVVCSPQNHARAAIEATLITNGIVIGGSYAVRPWARLAQA
jgi:hypothetical protein